MTSPAQAYDQHLRSPEATCAHPPADARPAWPLGNGQIKSPEVYLEAASNPYYVQGLLLLQPITEHVDIHLRLRRPIRR